MTSAQIIGQWALRVGNGLVLNTLLCRPKRGKNHHFTIRVMVVTSSHVCFSSSYAGEYPRGGNMALELFFVSARTNKRHHHHHGSYTLAMCVSATWGGALREHCAHTQLICGSAVSVIVFLLFTTPSRPFDLHLQGKGSNRPELPKCFLRLARKNLCYLNQTKKEHNRGKMY